MRFNVSYYVENIQTGYGTMCYLPRIGETMILNGYSYIVSDIVYRMDNGCLQDAFVSIYLKQRWNK